jgi:hypothetical protein
LKRFFLDFGKELPDADFGEAFRGVPDSSALG